MDPKHPGQPVASWGEGLSGSLSPVAPKGSLATCPPDAVSSLRNVLLMLAAMQFLLDPTDSVSLGITHKQQ